MDHVPSSDEQIQKTLAIVTGANGAVGRAYLEKMVGMPNMQCVGITRSEPEQSVPGVEYVTGVDLSNQEQVEQAIESIRCGSADKILLISPVGKFKFEEHPGNGQDDVDKEVMLSNVGTWNMPSRPSCRTCVRKHHSLSVDSVPCPTNMTCHSGARTRRRRIIYVSYSKDLRKY